MAYYDWFCIIIAKLLIYSIPFKTLTRLAMVFRIHYPPVVCQESYYYSTMSQEYKIYFVITQNTHYTLTYYMSNSCDMKTLGIQLETLEDN